MIEVKPLKRYEAKYDERGAFVCRYEIIEATSIQQAHRLAQSHCEPWEFLNGVVELEEEE